MSFRLCYGLGGGRGGGGLFVCGLFGWLIGWLVLFGFVFVFLLLFFCCLVFCFVVFFFWGGGGGLENRSERAGSRKGC